MPSTCYHCGKTNPTGPEAFIKSANIEGEVQGLGFEEDKKHLELSFQSGNPNYFLIRLVSEKGWKALSRSFPRAIIPMLIKVLQEGVKDKYIPKKLEECGHKLEVKPIPVVS